MSRLLLGIPEAARSLSVSRSTAYELIKNGDLEVTHIGRRALVTMSSLERYVARLSSEQARTQAAEEMQ